MNRFRTPDPRSEPLSRSLRAPTLPVREARGLRCFLTAHHPERALSLALVQHLSEEMPDIRFLHEHRPGRDPAIDVVWLLGYERGSSQAVRQLRERYPAAVLVVTASAREPWEGEVLAAGADCALSWPVDYRRLSAALHRRSVQRRA